MLPDEQSVGFAELPDGLAVFSRAQAEHQLLPQRFGQRLAAMEHFVAAQPHFPVVRGPHTRSLNRNLLAHHHAVAALATGWRSFPPEAGYARRPVRTSSSIRKL